MQTPAILIVNANRSELEMLDKELEHEGHVTFSASSLDELDGAIEGRENIKLALLDITGFANSDAKKYYGSGQGNQRVLKASKTSIHGRSYSLMLTLPPLAAIFLKRKG
ncbi:alpha amylase C-terminal domain-containing protein [Chloroflexota bacterium]